MVSHIDSIHVDPLWSVDALITQRFRGFEGASCPTTISCLKPELTPFLAERYRGTSLIRNKAPLGPYSRTMPMALWWS